MAVDEIRFLAIRAMTYAVLDELPLTGWSFSATLQPWQTPGSLTGSMWLDDPRAGLDVLEEGETLILVERGGQVLWLGMLWSTDPDPEGRTLGLNALELWSFWSFVHVTETQTFVAKDKGKIARDLLAYSVGKTRSPFSDLVIGTETTGRTIDKTFKWWESRKIAECVEALAKGKKGGFEFSIAPSWDGVTLTLTFEVHVPRKGGVKDVVLEWGANVVSYGGGRGPSVPWVRLLGEGNATSMKKGDASDLDGRLRLEVVQNARTNATQTVIDEQAEQLLAAVMQPTAVLQLVTQEGVGDPPELGTVMPGDTVSVVVEDVRMQVDETFRVLGVSVEPLAESSMLKVTYDVVTLEAMAQEVV